MIIKYCDHCGLELVYPNNDHTVGTREDSITSGILEVEYDLCHGCFEKIDKVLRKRLVTQEGFIRRNRK